MSSRTYHGELTDQPQYGVQERADAEIALFWQAQDDAARAQISDRRVEPRWLRALALIIAALMCGVFARVLLMP